MMTNIHNRFVRSISFVVLLAMIFFFGSMTSPARADALGERHTFFVNTAYDADKRESIPATLVYVSAHAYWYLDDTYQSNLSPDTVTQFISQFATEFDVNIYSKETAFFGSEPNPGVDNDPRITILFERLNSGTGGYFFTANEYPRQQVPQSNQREMVMLSASSITNSQPKVLLAHEFQHLIDYNQKDLLNKTSEETWLNELRSQYAITHVGYNDSFFNSDLRRRMQTFLSDPSDSLTEWPNTDQDYATTTMFGEYLVEHYGPQILSESLHSPLTGIASINAYLTAHGYQERFGDIFTNWVIANILNNTSVDARYGYTRPELQTIHAAGNIDVGMNYPAPLQVNNVYKPWQADWETIGISGTPPSGQNLLISWDNPAFSVAYVDNLNRVRILTNPSLIDTAGLQRVTLIPVNQSKLSGFSDTEATSPIAISMSFTDQTSLPSPTPTPTPVPALHDGMLIMPPDSSDLYVITGAYRRYLNPAVLKFYGLDAASAVRVSSDVFFSYKTANYVRALGDKKVYAVWPDGTKHWLNITGAQFTASGRDWGAIFTINNLESNFYKTGIDIVR